MAIAAAAEPVEKSFRFGYAGRRMSVIPFRSSPKRQRWAAAIVMAAAVLLGLAHVWTSPSSPLGIFAVDGDTVRYQGQIYRLVGFDTPERGYKARCEDERQRAEAATSRLRQLIAGGEARLERVACGPARRGGDVSLQLWSAVRGAHRRWSRCRAYPDE
ncbi:thermonuclease family protein [Bradyrhizobium sp. Bra64]|uniref:thermonuclease family protein n=1 Tax=Bradyrhizobium sp. Bra64 TaxID=2926009 RepID=UPI0021188C43|nr:hypothetical protein [Bradyrhizobium sp. Bra64]